MSQDKKASRSEWYRECRKMLEERMKYSWDCNPDEYQWNDNSKLIDECTYCYKEKYKLKKMGVIVN
jgi:hypothetical protein